MGAIPDLARLLSDRRSRLPLAALLVAAPILALTPQLRSLVSRNAMVTAFVYTARAPISGRLASGPGPSGTVIADGKRAAFVEDPRVDDALVSELRAGERGARELVKRLDDQRRVVADLEARASQDLTGYRGGFGRDLDRRVEALDAEVRGLDARIVEARAKASRVASLRSEGMAADADRDAAVAALESLEADRAARAAERTRLQGVRAELGEGRLLNEGLDDAVRLQAALERLRLQRVDLETSRVRAASDLAAAAARLESAEKRLGLVRRSPVEVPDGVLVWQSQVMEGQFVEAGAPVFSFVDCRQLLLDMKVDDSVLSLVRQGQPSWFRVFGSYERHPARVAFVRGSGAVMRVGTLAAAVERGDRDGQVLSAVEPDPRLAAGADFCGIGRTAYAKLDGVGLYREFVGRLFL